MRAILSNSDNVLIEESFTNGNSFLLSFSAFFWLCELIFLKRLQRHRLWNSTWNRSAAYSELCGAAWKADSIFSGLRSSGDFPWIISLSKKASIDRAYPKANRLSFPWGSNSKLSAAIDQPSVVKNTTNCIPCLIDSWITSHFHALLATLPAW